MEPDSPPPSDLPPPPPPPDPRGRGARFEPSAPPPSEWDAPPVAATDAARRASVLLWILAVLDIIFFGSCTLYFVYAAATPVQNLPELKDHFTPEQIHQLQPLFVPMALLGLVLGILPGLFYLITAFAVRRRHPLAINLTMVVVMTQAIVCGVLLLFGVIGSVMTANPQEMTLNFLLFGTYLALLGITLVNLWKARGEAFRSSV